jgi:hypothetical protein
LAGSVNTPVNAHVTTTLSLLFTFILLFWYLGSKVQGSGFKGSGFRVLGSKVQGSGFKGSKVQRFRVLGSKVQGSGFKGSKVQGSGFKGSGFRVQRFKGSKVQGSGFKGSGFWVQRFRVQGLKVLASDYTLLSFDIASDLDLHLVNL